MPFGRRKSIRPPGRKPQLASSLTYGAFPSRGDLERIASSASP